MIFERSRGHKDREARKQQIRERNNSMRNERSGISQGSGRGNCGGLRSGLRSYEGQ